MIAPPFSKIAIGAGIIIVAGGLVLFIGHQHKSPVAIVSPSGSPQTIAPPPIVHTATWYVAHPDVLKQDEQRCAGNAASIPQTACQNAASADAQIAAGDFAKAAAQNAAAGAKPSGTP